MNIRYDNFTNLNTDELTTTQLEVWHTTCCQDIESIAAQIDRANQEQQVNGVLADPDWYRRVTFAYKARLRTREALAKELHKRRAEGDSDRGQREHDLAWHFLEVCRQHMPADSFQRALALAEKARRAEAKQPLALEVLSAEITA